MHLIVVGFNYKKTPLALREALALDREASVNFAKKLNNQEVIEETLILSTCNRTEFYVISPCVEGAVEAVYQTIAEEFSLNPNELTTLSYFYSDIDALRHLFRVASSLDAMVVGEAQILGQFKASYQAAAEYETAGPYIHKICHTAFRIAKKVRTETDIAGFPVSVGTLAVELLEEEFGNLGKITVLVIGAGEMGELVAARLKDRGVSHIWVTNRTSETAERLAHQVGGVTISFDSWKTHLATADVVVTSIGGGQLIDKEYLSKVGAERAGRPLFILDLAIPRNVESVKISGVKICNIDDLQMLADKNLSARRKAAARAEEIVNAETATAYSELGQIKLAPMIRALQTKCETVMKTELEEVFTKHPELTNDEKSSIERCTQLIIKKIMHDPIILAKEELARPGANGKEISAILQKMFNLES